VVADCVVGSLFLYSSIRFDAEARPRQFGLGYFNRDGLVDVFVVSMDAPDPIFMLQAVSP
jgi:hypothetical protein